MAFHDAKQHEVLKLGYDGLNVDVSIPASLNNIANSWKHDYVEALSSENLGLVKPTNAAELLASFLLFVASKRKSLESGTNFKTTLLLEHVWQYYDSNILNDNDIHVLSATLPVESDKQRLIDIYYSAKIAAGIPWNKNNSALLRAQDEGRTRVYGIFGGQGNTRAYFEDLCQVYSTYKSLISDLIASADGLLQSLAQDPKIKHQYLHGLSVMDWIENPESQPPVEYLVSAPVSFPLIGLLQLAYLKAICLGLGGSPDNLSSFFRGLTGHSQGIVVATVVATATTWAEFDEAAEKAIKILFWIGCRSQQTFRETPLVSSKAENHPGQGTFSPMLSVANIPAAELTKYIKAINRFLPVDSHMHVALINSHNNFVVSGPQRTLAALHKALQGKTTIGGQEQIPFSQRKSMPTMRFLPVTAPFHCSLLEHAVSIIEDDLQDIQISPKSLRISVNRLSTGEDLNSRKTTNLVPDLIRMVTCEPVTWQDVAFPDATHIIDFGPGGSSGVGALTQRNNVGSGTRVIVAGVLHGAGGDLGSRIEIFDRTDSSIRWGNSWSRHHGVSLVRTAAGTIIDSKLSRLTGLPPFIIGGMTPTTTHPDFVNAAMQAGYHIELAGGGYRNAAEMTAALTQLKDSAPPGRGITVNLIYINPRAIAWQIPLIRQLREKGFPISGLTIGGGVPSVDVASEYITTIGLEHISFKPGSVSSIYQVIDIAKKHPEFPVILQWTGGRGGGHHSYEDFHDPILETYHDIRQCENLILVAGSGFGSAVDIYPYLMGSWSLSFGRSALMPFDGFLFGSRVMLCKEAHTSAKVKEAIAAAEGVDNADWDLTYKGNAGGIVSVTSEMGQPIHVLATRGAMFWAEMDRTVFKLEKSKRQKVLDSKRNYIINKLNNDFQKVWFGQKQASTPTACEVEEMSYAEVLHRMVQLMFIKRQTRWIDDSYRTMLIDFLIRTEERFAPPEVTTAMVGDADGLTNPSEVVDMILTVYPAARDTLLRTEDVHYFKQLCSRPNQKPVPFVPALDGNFETWFKKDSLWQSENLEAVIDQDIGRTFVLQGPVAVRHSRIVDESVKDVMDSINFGTIDTMVKEMYNGNEDSITQEEYIQRSTGRGYDKTVHHSLHLVRDGSAGSIDISSLKSDELISLLAGRVNSWRRALFESENFVQGTKLVENPMRNLLSSLDADVLQIAHCDDPGHAVLTLCKKSEGGENKVMIRFEKIANTILVQPYTRVTANKLPVSLVLKYEYFPANGYAPIREVVEDRDQRIYDFYRQLWLGEVDPTKSTARRVQRPETASFEDKFTVDDAVVRKFNQTIGYDVAYKHEQVPMDLAIVLCWKPISQALLQAPVQGDLLKLVHLSNSFELARHAAPLAFGDELRAVAGVQSITIEDSGKILEIACKLFRSGDEVMTVTSRFLFRGAFSDFSCTFSRTVEQPMGMGPLAPLDVEILTSKPWIQLTCPKSELLNANLVFKLQNFTTYKSKNVLRKVKTTGEVFRRTSDGKLCPIGSVLYRAGESHGNPVISYLSRCGERVDGIRPLDSAAPMTGDAIEIVIPPTNEGYSNVSGDFNPIHTSPMFASYAGLPGTITHGMYCSAVVRQAVEKYAANQSSERVRKYEASFVGMVLPGDVLEVSFHHTAMLDGLKVVKIEVKKQNTGEKVLEGEAHVAQLPTTIVFTGQGSQEKNMGMELYETSTIARKVWDQADAYFENQFGLRITDIVRNNPTELTVYFGGITGRMLRENYMAMTYEVPGRDGILERRPIFPEIDRQTTSYSHKSPKGLLFATQFAQPALTIMELASFKDMDSKGLVPADSYFAGHSLGEYSALAAVTEFMPFERLLYIVFCRGLTMQAAVDRDALNRSSFGMIAVDPGRVSKVFTDKKLRELVETLCKVTGYFVEIVNFNIRGQQYVCAGDLRALDCLQRVMDEIKTLQLKTPLEGKSLEEAITKHAKFNEGRAVPSIELRRGYATVPLPGVDVPFHSSFLLSRMEPFRQVLLENLDKGRVDPDRLVGKYIPNVTGTPFEITKEYFEEVLKATNSERVKAVLDQWETRWMPKVREEGLAAA